MSLLANNPTLTSWVSVPQNSDFPIQNLPFASFKRKDNGLATSGVAIGDQIIV